MALSDYTTLPYHLANKTYIDFVLKLISGIVGIVLNIVLIPKIGLEGAGIATLMANFVYFFLSTVIRMPNLELRFPARTILRMLIAFIPFAIIFWGFKYIPQIPVLIQMFGLLGVFYGIYFVVSKTVLKRPV